MASDLFTELMHFLHRKKGILRQKVYFAACAHLCCWPPPAITPHSMSELQRRWRTGLRETCHYTTASDPRCSKGLLSFYLHAPGEKQQPWNVCLFSSLLQHFSPSPNVITRDKEVKHLHQLQADIENLFNYSPQSSICLTFQWNTKQIFFPMNTDDTIVPHSNSCPPPISDSMPT